jgi:hypothetical protein
LNKKYIYVVPRCSYSENPYLDDRAEEAIVEMLVRVHVSSNSFTAHSTAHEHCRRCKQQSEQETLEVPPGLAHGW